MALEIERKFLLLNDSWRQQVSHQQRYEQAYFANTDKVSIRVRIGGDEANISFKSTTIDITRHEFEYSIPIQEAREMIVQFAEGSAIIKTRYYIKTKDHVWEIDEFEGDNAGLVVAELELSEADEYYDKPEWLGAEVSDDPRYFNCNLVTHPWKNW